MSYSKAAAKAPGLKARFDTARVRPCQGCIAGGYFSSASDENRRVVGAPKKRIHLSVDSLLPI